ETGDMPARSQYLEELGRLADDRRQPLYQYVYRCYHVQSAMFEGRFSDAERIASQAAVFGQNIPELATAGGFGVQMLSLRREQGRLPETLPILQHFEANAAPDAEWRPGLMLLYSELGQADKARAIYDQLAKHKFETIRVDARWLMTIVYLAE